MSHQRRITLWPLGGPRAILSSDCARVVSQKVHIVGAGRGLLADVSRVSVCCMQASGGKKSSTKSGKAAPKPVAAEGAPADAAQDPDDPLASSTATGRTAAVPDPKEKKGRSKGESLYYRVKCKDNGVGMPHDKVCRSSQATLSCFLV